MSSNGATGKPVVTNPYAKKRKFPPTTAANHGGVASRPPPAAASTSGPAPGLNPVKLGGGGAFTFSQAFGSVEDTAHFKNQIKNQIKIRVDNNQPPPDPESAAAQRALDQQEATNANANLLDRDHHVLLQPHVLYVSTKQRGNGILKHIRNVPIAYSKMVPDYIMSTTRCALFLSIKYHQLFPNYIHRRLGELKTDFTLRILLVLVDTAPAQDNANNALLFLNTLAVTHNLTLILAWTEQEAARYLETFKALDGKDASLIQKRSSTDDHFVDQVADYLTACKPVNKTDSQQLLAHFSSIRALAGAASPDELALCPGLGPTKVQRLWDAFHKPFSKRGAKERKKKKEQEAAGVVVGSSSANGNGGARPTTEAVNNDNDKKDEEEENKVKAAGDGDTEQDATKENDKATKETNEKSGLQRSLVLLAEQDVVDLTSRSKSKTQPAQAASNENFQRSLALAGQDVVDLTPEEEVVDLTSRSRSNANNVSTTRRVAIPTISATNFYAKATTATNALLSSQGTSTQQRAASQTSAPVNPYSSTRVVVPAPACTKPKTTKPKATTRTLTSLLSGVKTTDELLNPTTTTITKAANSVHHASRNLKPPSLPPPAYQKTSNVVASTNSARKEKEQKTRKKRKSS